MNYDAAIDAIWEDILENGIPADIRSDSFRDIKARWAKIIEQIEESKPLTITQQLDRLRASEYGDLICPNCRRWSWPILEGLSYMYVVGKFRCMRCGYSEEYKHDATPAS